VSNYSKINSVFSDKPSFTRSEFTDYIRTANPALRENSYGWLLYDLCQKNIFERVARNTYRAYTGTNSLRSYVPLLSDNASDILGFLQIKFPLLKFIVWETQAYNEFANHQLARNHIFVESEKLLCESVFNTLREQGRYTTLYKPGEKEITLYSGDVTVSVLSLTSEAPISGYNTKLEKLLVDLFANKLLEKIISRGDYAGIYEEAFSKYNINYSLMLRYAKRRNKAAEIMRFIEEKTAVAVR